MDPLTPMLHIVTFPLTSSINRDPMTTAGCPDRLNARFRL